MTMSISAVPWTYGNMGYLYKDQNLSINPEEKAKSTRLVLSFKVLTLFSFTYVKA